MSDLVHIRGDLVAQEQQLRTLQQRILSMSIDDVVDVEERARMAREYLRITKQAGRVRVEALRVELLALRRIGQLGATQLLGSRSGAKAQAKLFATLDDTAWAEVMRLCEDLVSPTVVYRHLQGVEHERSTRVHLDYVYAGQHVAIVPPSWDEMVIAAHVMLDRADDEGEAITVPEAALALAKAYGRNDDLDRAQMVGLEFAVRTAIRHADASTQRVAIDGVPSTVPAFVTYEEDEAGYVRVPFKVASIEQLTAMARARRSQAEALAIAAANLERVADVLAAVIAGYGDRTCGEALDDAIARGVVDPIDG